MESIPLKDAKLKFLDEKEQTQRRSITLRDYKVFFNRITEWDGKMLNEIDERTARAILDQKYTVKRTTRKQKDKKVYRIPRFETKQYSPYNKFKFAKAMSALYVWAIDRGYAKLNPFKKFAKNDIKGGKKAVRILTNAQVRKFMAAAPDDLRPGFAMMAFAGIRPYELCADGEKTVLKWSDVDFDKRQILIDGDVAKTGYPRRITGLPDNLWNFLKKVPKAKRKGAIMKCSVTVMTDARLKMCKAAEIDKWTADVLRHCYGSHSWHKLGAELTVENMGHESGFAVLARHYKGVSSPEEADEYFNIMP